ncbi:cytochrome d ubiquinol oxidase subunit II [Stackebrandtia soli]|uniref:cytochrome d ubiquinol oxidase subunit II n=1 Tax=Stackebrandtia soli TaxID=1892856 RepID=UPI0039EC6A1E
MTETFVILLGLVFAGYFALAGYDYGVGSLLTAVARTDVERRYALGALGPFFLGNEVWLVAGLGLLLGAFPLADGVLLSGLYPILIGLIGAIVAFTALVQLRSRLSGARRLVDGVIVAAGVLIGIGWGAAFGALLQGLPVRIGPLPILFGLLMVALFVLHGAVLLASRTHGVVAERARRIATRMVHPAVVLVVVTGLAAALDGDAIRNPVFAVAGAGVLAASVGAAGRAVRAGRLGIGLVASGAAAAMPVLIVGAATAPYLVVHSGGESVTFAAAIAGDVSLAFMTAAVVPLLPVLLAFQAATWWIWRRAPRRPNFY